MTTTLFSPRRSLGFVPRVELAGTGVNATEAFAEILQTQAEAESAPADRGALLKLGCWLIEAAGPMTLIDDIADAYCDAYQGVAAEKPSLTLSYKGKTVVLRLDTAISVELVMEGTAIGLAVWGGGDDVLSLAGGTVGRWRKGRDGEAANSLRELLTGRSKDADGHACFD
jgi:hypothetical protein